MLVKDLLQNKGREVVTTTTDTPIETAMGTLIKRKISCLPVVDDNDKLIGIVSDKDIFRKLYETKGDGMHVTIGEIMTTDLIVGVPDDTVAYIAGVMTNNRIRHIPIIESHDGNDLVGLLSVGDIVKTRMEDMKVENRYLREYIAGDYPR